MRLQQTKVKGDGSISVAIESRVSGGGGSPRQRVHLVHNIMSEPSDYAARAAPADFSEFMAAMDAAHASNGGVMVDADLFEEFFGHAPGWVVVWHLTEQEGSVPGVHRRLAPPNW